MPVAVKNPGMPAPAALNFSARVPWGVSSTSISPLRNYFSNIGFSPTYETISFLIYLF